MILRAILLLATLLALCVPAATAGEADGDDCPVQTRTSIGPLDANGSLHAEPGREIRFNFTVETRDTEYRNLTWYADVTKDAPDLSWNERMATFPLENGPTHVPPNSTRTFNALIDLPENLTAGEYGLLVVMKGEYRHCDGGWRPIWPEPQTPAPRTLPSHGVPHIVAFTIHPEEGAQSAVPAPMMASALMALALAAAFYRRPRHPPA